ncbi:hypothetical protein [Foetidibacter luteolus]|uniref:hypothetical protein n=1 Tax=Foetidibacter luteolus TaxID=2608880 RepID=UPI00129BBF04|nr:hypothetical protein [Foetidibacter luteolus]
MKFIIPIFVTLSLITTPIYTQAINSKGKISFIIDQAFMQACEKNDSLCKPVTIIRKSIQDSIEMIFPTGGSQTDVYIYVPDSAFAKWVRGVNEEEPQPLRHVQKLYLEGKPIVDITSLPDGNYLCWMLGCNLGGSFGLVLTTKKEEDILKK